MKPPFWWSELRARGACKQAMKRHRNAVDFGAALQNATRHEIEWLFNNLGLRSFMPKIGFPTEQEENYQRRLIEFATWHRNALLWQLKISFRARMRFTRVANQLSKAIRRR